MSHQYHHFVRDSKADAYRCGKCGVTASSPTPTLGCEGDPNPSIVTGRPVNDPVAKAQAVQWLADGKPALDVP